MKKLENKFAYYFILGTQNFKNCSKDTQIEKFKMTLESACRAGIDYFQFRDKDDTQLSPQEQIDLPKYSLEICKEYCIPFIVDDRLDLLNLLDADGIHVGQSDLDAKNVSDYWVI